MTEHGIAPGWPGIAPRWTSSAKQGVGTALEATSRVWFTLSHGVLNEVYYPRLDQACVRDLGLIVTDGATFFSEERRHAASTVAWLAPGVPGFVVTNTCHAGRYRIVKEVLADPRRDVVLQRTVFQSLPGDDQPALQLYLLLAPHLANGGWGNTAWVGDYKGVPMLFAERNGLALALGCTPSLKRGSAGFVGASDGWQDLNAHKHLTHTYQRAENGNVALTGELDVDAPGGECLIALGFGITPEEAGFRVRASLLDGFDRARTAFVTSWSAWQHRVAISNDAAGARRTSVAVSAAVIRTHEEKRLPGGIIASLSIPWGNTKGDSDLGGYHLVWPRDLVETAGALVALGTWGDARRVLDYLRVTQNADGSWPQNMWLDGRPYWHGVQLDETAFPVLLVDLLRRSGHLDEAGLRAYWPMVRTAAAFVVRNGPSSEQDRWEEDAGLSPFTVAVEVSALLIAAEVADGFGEPAIARDLRDTADAWNEALDSCTYATGTELAARVGVEGYYVRVAPLEIADGASPLTGFVPIKNRAWPQPEVPAVELVSPDALALVRFGLRAADDPKILNTVRVIDALLKVDLPSGPGWRRYNGDGYGEQLDGRAFNGAGLGRVWPLLTGERAHYELAAGRRSEATRLLAAFEACAGEGGLLPEQVWESEDIPARELFRGRPSGSAMPLVWAHAEHIKLVRSVQDGRVFDMPEATRRRYVVEGTTARYACWRFNHKIRSVPAGRDLRVEALEPFVLHWSSDTWATTADATSRDTALGIHVVDVAVGRLPAGDAIDFTFYWPKAQRWENQNYRVSGTP